MINYPDPEQIICITTTQLIYQNNYFSLEYAVTDVIPQIL